MQLISRQDAIKYDLPCYFTGEVCKYGHTDKRYTATRQCVACTVMKSKSYRDNNKTTIAEKAKIKYETNPEVKREYSKQYRINNEYDQKYHSDYHKNRMKTDPVYALCSRTRVLIYQKIQRGGYTKKSRTYDILGCSFVEFKSFIEKQFAEGMSWDNHGDWHLDHIIPCAVAKTEDDVIRLNHYTNFQPLWKLDNLKKGAKSS